MEGWNRVNEWRRDNRWPHHVCNGQKNTSFCERQINNYFRINVTITTTLKATLRKIHHSLLYPPFLICSKTLDRFPLHNKDLQKIFPQWRQILQLSREQQVNLPIGTLGPWTSVKAGILLLSKRSTSISTGVSWAGNKRKRGTDYDDSLKRALSFPMLSKIILRF